MSMGTQLAGSVLILFSLALQQNPAAQKPAGGQDTGVEVSALALEAAKFCDFGPKTYLAYIPIDITIVNGRHTPIILANQAHVQRVLVGKSSEDLLANKHQVATPLQALRSRDVAFGLQPSGDDFSILKHNQSYMFTAVEGIPVSRDAAHPAPGAVLPGDAAMSLEVQTWPYARDPGAVRRQWSKFGDLISTTVTSIPTLLKLPANPPVEKCGLPLP